MRDDFRLSIEDIAKETESSDAISGDKVAEAKIARDAVVEKRWIDDGD